MKIVIVASLVLLCLAGLIKATKQKASVPSSAQLVTKVPTLQVSNLKVADDVATFKLINYSNEQLTGISVASGRHRITADSSYVDGTIPSTKAYLINLDGAQPLTIEAAIYASGKSEGDQAAIQSIMDTREGHRIGIGKILADANHGLSIADVKAAASAFSAKEEDFKSPSVRFGANEARDQVLERLARIEALTEQEKIDRHTREFHQWMKARAK